MAPAASKSKINTTLPKRGQIKIKIFNIIAKSLQNSAVGFVGEKKKSAAYGGGRVDRCCSSTATVILPSEELKPASKHETKQNRPRRGQIKIKICKMVAKLIKDSAVWVAGGKKKDAGSGNGGGGCSGGGSTATVWAVETTGGLKPDSKDEIKQDRPIRVEIKIKIPKITGLKNTGGKKKGSGFRLTEGIVPIEAVSRFETEIRF